MGGMGRGEAGVHTILPFQFCCSESCLIFLVQKTAYLESERPEGTGDTGWWGRGARGGGREGPLLLPEMTYTPHFHKSTPDEASRHHWHGMRLLRAACPHTVRRPCLSWPLMTQVMRADLCEDMREQVISSTLGMPLGGCLRILLLVCVCVGGT